LNAIISKPRITEQWFTAPLIWLLFAISSFVFIEPPPHDLLTMALIILFFILGLKIPVGIRPGVLLLGVFLLANVISCIYSADPAATIKSLLIRFYLVISWIFFVSLIYESPERILKTIWSGYMFAATIAAILGIAAFFDLLPAFRDQLLEFGRVRSLFKDPNVYGPFLVPVAIYAFARLISGETHRRLPFTLFFLLMLMGILLGFSRGSWINTIVSFAIFMGMTIITSTDPAKIKRLASFSGIFIMLALLIGGISLTTEKVQHMIEIRTKLQKYDLQAGGRFENQLVTLEHTLTNPLGVGAGQSELIFFRAPHNIYIHVLIESGWIGAICFYVFLAVTLHKGYKSSLRPSPIQPTSIVALACLLGILAQSVAIDSTHWRHLYLLFAMIWGAALALQDKPYTVEA